MKIELELKNDKPIFRKLCIVLCDDGCEDSPYLSEDVAYPDKNLKEGWGWAGTYHANVIGWSYVNNILTKEAE